MRRGGWLLISVLASGERLGAPDELRYAPEAGSVLERRWSEALDLEVDALEESIDGNPVELPFSSIVFESRREFTVEDSLKAVEGGRATDFERTLGESMLHFKLSLDERPVGEVHGRARCQGSAVRLVLDAETGEYERSVEEGTIEAEHLARLEPDLDLLELLPEAEVEEGATWKLDPLVLRRFFAAGGDLFDPGELVVEMAFVPREILVAGAIGSLHELLGAAEEVTGKVEATYAGREESEDGLALARIELELEVAAEVDLGARLSAFMEEPDSEREFRLTGELEGKLVVLWDLEAHHLSSARFEGDASLAGRLAFPVQLAEGQSSGAFVGEYELSGQALVELDVD